MEARPDGRVRVHVSDGHPLYREALARSIDRHPGFEVVGEASEGRAALADIKRLAPDVAVFEMAMPGLDGLALAQAIRRDDCPTRVVVVSAQDDSEDVYGALAAGADAYILKTADSEEICRTIAAVARGQTRLAPAIQTHLLKEIHSRAPDGPPRLTPREEEILELTAEGFSAPDIGNRLHLSTATIKTHQQHLYEKLGVSDRAAAVAEAMRQGLME